MKFRHHSQLRIFTSVARHVSLTDAARELNLTKGAVSHQIRQLESALKFSVFDRLPRGVSLTSKGGELLICATQAYGTIEEKIQSLQQVESRVLTVGVTTYFASRWLSSRLMKFMQQHPDIRLRLEPMIELMNLEKNGIDLAVRWGKGDWKDVETSLLFQCPAWPSGNRTLQQAVDKNGLEQVIKKATLLHDTEDSKAWPEWFAKAGINYHGPVNTLIIPDPNVRVQAVIDGQGIALHDALVEQELCAEQLYRLGEAELGNYGYYLVRTEAARLNTGVAEFSSWLKEIVADG